MLLASARARAPVQRLRTSCTFAQRHPSRRPGLNGAISTPSFLDLPWLDELPSHVSMQACIVPAWQARRIFGVHARNGHTMGCEQRHAVLRCRVVPRVIHPPGRRGRQGP